MLLTCTSHRYIPVALCRELLADLWNPHCLDWLTIQLLQEQDCVELDDFDIDSDGLADLSDFSSIPDYDDNMCKIDPDDVSVIYSSTGSFSDTEDAVVEGYLSDLASDNESTSLYLPSDASVSDRSDSDSSTDSVVLLFVHKTPL